MDAVLQTQFERVEAALTSLVDSIATFNPSPQAALDLVAADDDLSNGLDQLSHHQANHTRILALRSEAETLEAQLKTSVGALASLRTQLLEAPTTPFPEDSRPVASDELLQYAMKISNFTVPPTFREPLPKAVSDEEKEKVKEDGTSSGMPTNAAPTPAVAEASSGPEEEDKKEVTPEQAKWLEDMQARGVSWFPWPDNNKIRSGNLMMVQLMLDQNKDPWTDKVPTQQELEDVARRQKDAEEQEEARAHAQAQAAQEPIPPKDQAVPAPRPEPQQVQQFQGFDFGEDDDD